MEKFWAVILIFAIVAAGGLLYVNQVYEPQKDAQIAMADTANQTLMIVRAEMDSADASRNVSGASVIQEVRYYCNKPGNTVEITVISKTLGAKVFIDNSGEIEDHVGGTSKQFVRTPNYEDGKLAAIEFEEL
jgi:hypothetical protein